MSISSNEYYDMRVLNKYYKPLISEEEFELLQEKLNKKK
jgi:hypothetical protein